MTRLLGSTLLAVAIISSLPAAEELEGQGGVTAADELIERLGDDSYPVREKATFDLWALGEKARPMLVDAIDSEDPEVIRRARSVLRKVELGILPDSPPEVVELVVQYDSASADERQAIIRRLKRLKAWRQVLRMHELERDPLTLERIAGEMAGVAVEAARELLASDEPDFSSAREFLEMARPEPPQLMALADFHRAAGSLENELERAAELEGRAGHLWRYALNAAKGDLAAAAKEAQAAGLAMIGPRLMALSGDPIPWIRSVPVPPQQIPPDALEDYRREVVDLWRGEPLSTSLVNTLRRAANHGEVEQRLGNISTLYALGRSDDASVALADLVPVLAFFHYDNNERIDDAFRSLGLNPEKPDYAAWAAEKFEKVIEEPDESDQELNALATLGWFLERRGLDQEAREIFYEPLLELGRQDPEVFLDKTNELFTIYSFNRITWPVLEASAVFAGDDGGRLIMVRDNLFGEGVHVSPLWESVLRYDEQLGAYDRLRMMAEILGHANDRNQSFDKWWQWGKQVVSEGKKEDQREMAALMLLMTAARSDGGRSDAARFLEMTDLMRSLSIDFDELGEIGDNYRFSDYELACLVATNRWDDVVEKRRQFSAGSPNDPIRRAYLAGALRRAGLEEEALEQERVVDRLVLGDVRSMTWIAKAYATCGDFERSGQWWWRSAVQTTGGIREFVFAMEGVLTHAKERADWALVASLGEVELLYQLMMGERFDQPWVLLRARTETEMARALSTLGDDREGALEILERCFRRGATDGSMADYFFPALRSAGLTQKHDEWFEEAWRAYREVLERFPGSQNTRNTAAWTAARANRRLDEAESLITQALEAMPQQAAYLDTLGEIWFCRKDREKALEWSGKALLHEPGESTLIRQHERFRTGPFPLD